MEGTSGGGRGRRPPDPNEKGAPSSTDIMLQLLIVGALVCRSSAVILGLKQGESCNAVNSRDGTCTLFSKCKDLGDFPRVQPPICSFKGIEPVICCPNDKSRLSNVPGSRMAAYCATMEKNCTQRRLTGTNEIVRHVIGGNRVKPRTHVHMVLIGYGNEDSKEWGCGGTLITTLFVLSAAHCSKPSLLGKAKWARLGDLVISSTTDDAEVQDREIVQRIPHPSYKEPRVYNDIAVFRLNEEVRLTPWVAPACLQVEAQLTAPKATVTGWGRIDFAGQLSNQLLEAELDIFSDEDCRRLLPYKDNKTPRGIDSTLMFCAGKRDGSRDACSGDSGGPLVTFTSEQCLKTQIGIVSYGDMCGQPDSPGVYTRVSKYIPWIEEVVFGKQTSVVQHDDDVFLWKT